MHNNQDKINYLATPGYNYINSYDPLHKLSPYDRYFEL